MHAFQQMFLVLWGDKALPTETLEDIRHSLPCSARKVVWEGPDQD